LFTILGWTAIPSRATTLEGAWRLTDPASSDDKIAAHVFTLRPDGVAVLSGDAEQIPDGTIRIGLYDPLDPMLVNATLAVSLPGDLRLLWLLASEQERTRLRGMASVLLIGLSDSLVATMQAPEFVADYRPQFARIAEAALTAAWQDRRIQAAWAQLLLAYEPIMREVATRELRPIVVSHFDGVAYRLMRANFVRLLLPLSGEWDLEPAEQAIQETIADVRARDIPEHTLERLLAPLEARQFLEVFANVIGDNLAHDPGLVDLVARMATDTRFRPALALAAGPAGDLARSALQLVVSLHGSTDLNLVASFVFHVMAAGQTERVVVLMSDRQHRDIAAMDPGVARLLRMARR
jgi:hypothetical protein